METFFKRHILPVKLFTAILYRDDMWLDKAKKILVKHYGSIDLYTDAVSFRETDYYRKEMGDDLKKVWYSFSDLIKPDSLANIKCQTHEIEESLKVESEQSGRVVNIDPGYIELSKIVLASLKNFSHRIYIGKGVFHEVTMIYKDKQFQELLWTYPDYKSKRMKDFFEQVRQKYYVSTKIN